MARGEIDRAQHALYRALALFRPAQVEARFGRVAEAEQRDATLVLLELARRSDQLSGSERELAERLLARPTDRRDPIKRYRAPARYRCDPTMCFWWVNRTADAPPLRDRKPRNGVPDQVDLTQSTFRHVWKTEVRSFGYQRPLSDRYAKNRGPNIRLDIYLADIGLLGIYGYCTTDDKRRNRLRTVSAYCVVDDDFSPRQFASGASGKAALEVTAAHEFFHAIQMGIDWREDLWLFESTAAWMEDEVYPAINDNLQYLPISPMGNSAFVLPLDVDEPDNSKPASVHKYGAWIFWRYLSERFGRDVVRFAWNRARGGRYTADVLGSLTYSQTFADVFHQFGIANYFFSTSYAEGGLYAGVAGVGPLVSQSIGVGSITGAIPTQHLTNDYYMLTPEGATATSTLGVVMTMPAPEAAPRASLIVMRATGNDPPVPLASGMPANVPFDTGVTGVLLVVTNASTRFAGCGTAQLPPFYSCFGLPVDDGASFGLNAQLVAP